MKLYMYDNVHVYVTLLMEWGLVVLSMCVLWAS